MRVHFPLINRCWCFKSLRMGWRGQEIGEARNRCILTQRAKLSHECTRQSTVVQDFLFLRLLIYTDRKLHLLATNRSCTHAQIYVLHGSQGLTTRYRTHTQIYDLRGLPPFRGARSPADQLETRGSSLWKKCYFSWSQETNGKLWKTCCRVSQYKVTTLWTSNTDTTIGIPTF